MVLLTTLILLCIPLLLASWKNRPTGTIDKGGKVARSDGKVARSDGNDNIVALQKKIAQLEYHTKMLQGRANHSVLGPMARSSLRPDLFARFSDYNMTMKNPNVVSNNEISQGQVPAIAKPYMTYSGPTKGWSKTWSADMVNAMVQATKKRQDISCQDYPQSALQVYEALDRVQTLDTSGSRPWNILIGGSISPWVEAIVLGRAHDQESSSASANSMQLYQNRVVTTDYNEILSESPRIQFVSMQSLKEFPPEPLFDMIVTYSSIEHDGLGRYGDPMNPEGDFCAMEEFSLMLRDGGWILVSVPVSQNPEMGFIDRNWHRIYSAARLERLFQGFERVGEPITGAGLKDWQNQPMYLLRKRNST